MKNRVRLSPEVKIRSLKSELDRIIVDRVKLNLWSGDAGVASLALKHIVDPGVEDSARFGINGIIHISASHENDVASIASNPESDVFLTGLSVPGMGAAMSRYWYKDDGEVDWEPVVDATTDPVTDVDTRLSIVRFATAVDCAVDFMPRAKASLARGGFYPSDESMGAALLSDYL